MVVRLVALLALACAAVAQEKPWWVVMSDIAIRTDGKATRPAGRFADRTPSPDGKHLVWAAWQGKNRDVYVCDQDGQNERRLTHHPAMDTSPTWSPDGKRIAFASHRVGRKAQVWIVPIARGLPQLVTVEEHGVWLPRFAPTGNRLAYIARVPLRRGKGWHGHIVVFDLVTRARTVIAKNLHMPSVAWSPDGKRLAIGAMASLRIYEGTKVVTNVDLPKADKRLYAHIAGALVWRPDGKELVCAITFAGGRAAKVRNDATGAKTVDFDRMHGDRELFFLTADGKLRSIEVARGVSVRPHHWAR